MSDCELCDIVGVEAEAEVLVPAGICSTENLILLACSECVGDAVRTLESHRQADGPAQVEWLAS